MFATKCKNETCQFTFTVGSVNMLNFLKLSMLCDICEKCKSSDEISVMEMERRY